jgi:ATP-binding cassette subfamily F protein 3
VHQDAVLWLQHELSTASTWQSRVVVCVSHDRTFLDAVCSDSLHISGVARRLTQERGNYSTWAKRRAAKKKAWASRSHKREAAMLHLEEFINRGGTYANVSVQRKMKEEQLARLRQEAAEEAEEQAALQEDEELALTIHAG